MNDVRDEALATLLERSATALDPASVDRLEEVLRRGGRRRALRSAAIAAAVAAFVGAVAWTGLHRPDLGDDAVVQTGRDRSEPASRTIHDTQDELTVTVPDGWVVADQNLTPWLSSPVEILSVGTFPLRVSNDPGAGLRLFDAPVAPQALEDMTADDVFISIQESGDFTGPPLPRPEHFGPRDCEIAVTGCEEDRYREIPFRAWWIPFEDAGRGLYLFIAIGNDAPAELRDQAWAVADSLVFEPLQP